MVNRIPGAETGTQSDGANGTGTDEVRRRFNADRSADKEWHGLVRAWRALGVRLPRLRVEASRYVAARVDLLKAKALRAAEGAAIGVVAAVVAIAVLATAAVLLLGGIAGALGQALGSAWAGDLVTGGGVLVLLIAAGLIGINRMRAGRLERLQKRYAEFDRASAMPPGDLPPARAETSPRANGAVS